MKKMKEWKILMRECVISILNKKGQKWCYIISKMKKKGKKEKEK